MGEPRHSIPREASRLCDAQQPRQVTDAQLVAQHLVRVRVRVRVRVGVRVRVRVTDAQLVAQHLRRQWVDGWGRGEWMVEGRVRKG